MLPEYNSTFKSVILLTRINRPVGIILLLLPCFWGLGFTKGTFFDYTIFFIGSILLRSAGCVFNDIIDKNLDAKVSRTKKRPIASNSLTVKQGYSVFLILLCLGLVIFYCLSKTAKIISLTGFVFLLIYPFLKRITYFPQIFLGLTFNIGVLVSTSHVLNYNDWLINKLPIILLYLAGIFWTIAYDTIYALQDYQDDIKVGIKSIPVYFKENTKYVILYSYSLMMICMFTFWIEIKTLLISIIFSLALSILIYRLFTIDYISAKAKDFDEAFKYNQLIGLWIWISIIIANFK